MRFGSIIRAPPWRPGLVDRGRRSRCSPGARRPTGHGDPLPSSAMYIGASTALGAVRLGVRSGVDPGASGLGRSVRDAACSRRWTSKSPRRGRADLDRGYVFAVRFFAPAQQLVDPRARPAGGGAPACLAARGAGGAGAPDAGLGHPAVRALRPRRRRLAVAADAAGGRGDRRLAARHRRQRGVHRGARRPRGYAGPALSYVVLGTVWIGGAIFAGDRSTTRSKVCSTCCSSSACSPSAGRAQRSTGGRGAPPPAQTHLANAGDVLVAVEHVDDDEVGERPRRRRSVTRWSERSLPRGRRAPWRDTRTQRPLRVRRCNDARPRGTAGQMVTCRRERRALGAPGGRRPARARRGRPPGLAATTCERVTTRSRVVTNSAAT